MDNQFKIGILGNNLEEITNNFFEINLLLKIFQAVWRNV